MSKIKPFILLVSNLLMLAGCGTAPIKPYQPVSQSISERTIQASGLEVALDPFVESSRTKEYFDIDAVANGIAILHVRVVNNTSNQTFLVEKKDFQLVRGVAGANLTGNGKKIESSDAAGNAIGWVGALAVSPVLLITASVMVSHSTEIQRNFTGKEMGDQTLSPGESMEGFIYFTPVNHGQDWTQGTAVKVKLTETKSQQLTELTIPLSH
jgi:hypothetical protein